MTRTTTSSHSLSEFLEVLPRAKRYDGYVAGLCPWHEDSHPSLFVYPDNFFRCIAEGCGEMGPHSKLYAKLQNPDSYFPQGGKEYYPPRIPNDLEGFAETAQNLLHKYPFRRRYLTERGICDMIGTARLGWYEGWYTVPVLGEDGEVKGMVLRASEPVQNRTGFRYITNQEPMPYIPARNLLERSEALAVVFGIFDALVIAEMGYPAVTTTGGAATFKGEWLDWWRLPVKIIPDEGEEATAYAVAKGLGWRGDVVRLTYPEGGKDVSDIYQLEGREKLKDTLEAILK